MSFGLGLVGWMASSGYDRVLVEVLRTLPVQAQAIGSMAAGGSGGQPSGVPGRPAKDGPTGTAFAPGGKRAAEAGLSAPRADAAPKAGGRGYVDLEKAVTSHPLWSELVKVRGQMEAAKARWQKTVDGFAVMEQAYSSHVASIAEDAAKLADIQQQYDNNGEPFDEMLQDSLKKYEEDILAEAEEAIQNRARELRARLDSEVFEAEGRMLGEMREFQDKITKEYYLTLVNLQLKLQLGKHTEEQEKELKDKIAAIEGEMRARIEDKRRELSEQHEAFVKQRESEVAAELAAYQDKVMAEARQKIEAEEARVAAELSRNMATMTERLKDTAESYQEVSGRWANTVLNVWSKDGGESFDKAKAKFDKEWASLKAMEAELMAKIEADIKRAAAAYSRMTGVSVSVVDHGPAAGRDVTGDVMQILRNE